MIFSGGEAKKNNEEGYQVSSLLGSRLRKIKFIKICLYEKYKHLSRYLGG
jgi:hypothetical protein